MVFRSHHPARGMLQSRNIARPWHVLLAMALRTVILAPVSGANPPDEDGVVRYKDTYPLLNSTFRTLAGARTQSGGCSFKFPPLTRKRGAGPLETRQDETDFRTCITTLETGIPGGEFIEFGRRARRGQHTTSNPAQASSRVQRRAPLASLAGAVTYTVRFTVTWEDLLNIDVNWLPANLT